jgi:hypothetical protein
VRYGSGLLELDLGEAYKKAGVVFRGQLEKNFVVLHVGSSWFNHESARRNV